MNIQWTLPKGRLVLIEVCSRSLKPDAWNQGKTDYYKKVIVDGADVEAPVIGLETVNKIMFSDGNHRTAVAIAKGLKTICIAVAADEADLIRNICKRASS